MSTSPYAPTTQNFNVAKASIVNSTGFISPGSGITPNATIMFYSGGVNGSVLRSLSIASDDSIARYVSLYGSLNYGVSQYLISTVSVPISGGANGIAANADALNGTLLLGLGTDQGSNKIIAGPSGLVLYAGVLNSAVTAGKTIHLWGVGEDL